MTMNLPQVLFSMLVMSCGSALAQPFCEGRELNLPQSEVIGSFSEKSNFEDIKINGNTWCQFGFDYTYFGTLEDKDLIGGTIPNPVCPSPHKSVH